MLNWKRLRAFGRPGFLRSTLRGSLDNKPPCRSGDYRVLVALDERSRQTQSDRVRLSGEPAPMHPDGDVESTFGLCDLEGLLDALPVRKARKVLAKGPSIDGPISGARAKKDASDACLTSSDGLDLTRCGHGGFVSLQSSSGCGD